MSTLDVEGGGAGEEGVDGGEGQQQPQQEPNWEAMARPEGWRPKEQFRGNPDDWVDAKTFVQRGREINPILRKNNERLQAEIQGVREELKEALSAVKSLQEYNAKVEQKAFERAMARLKQEKKAALAAGDHETAAELDEQLDELRDAKPTPAPAAPAPAPAAAKDPKSDPVLKAWMDENASWYNEDPENEEMVAYANSVSQIIRKHDPKMERFRGQSFLDELKRRVVKQFPDRFGRRTGSASMVEGAGGPGGGAAGGGGAKSLASLPADARAQYKQLASEKWYQDLAKSQKLTPEQMFMRDYGTGE